MENQTFDLVTTFSPIAKVDSMIWHLESGTVGCLSTQLGKIFYSLLWSSPVAGQKWKHHHSWKWNTHQPICLLPGGPPLSLFDMLLATGGREFRNLMFPLWFTLLGGFYCLPGHGSFHFVPCFSLLFLGCFGLFMIGRVHQ